MSNQDKKYFKIPKNFRSVEMKPNESHLLALLAKMDSVPDELGDKLQELLAGVDVQPPVLEVVEIFRRKKTVDQVSDEAHDLYTWVMLWAGKRDQLNPVAEPVESR